MSNQHDKSASNYQSSHTLWDTIYKEPFDKHTEALEGIESYEDRWEDTNNLDACFENWAPRVGEILDDYRKEIIELRKHVSDLRDEISKLKQK